MDKFLCFLGLFGSLTAATASNIGKDWGVERKAYEDPATGVRVWELTGPGSASDNLYYHFPISRRTIVMSSWCRTERVHRNCSERKWKAGGWCN